MGACTVHAHLEIRLQDPPAPQVAIKFRAVDLQLDVRRAILYENTETTFRTLLHGQMAMSCALCKVL